MLKIKTRPTRGTSGPWNLRTSIRIPRGSCSGITQCLLPVAIKIRASFDDAQRSPSTEHFAERWNAFRGEDGGPSWRRFGLEFGVITVHSLDGNLGRSFTSHYMRSADRQITTPMREHRRAMDFSSSTQDQIRQANSSASRGAIFVFARSRGHLVATGSSLPSLQVLEDRGPLPRFKQWYEGMGVECRRTSTRVLVLPAEASRLSMY